jgi:hypothetical protein
LYIINNALNEIEDAQLRNGLLVLLIRYLINIFYVSYFGSGSKAEVKSGNSTMSGRFCGSLMIPVTTLYIVIFAESRPKYCWKK